MCHVMGPGVGIKSSLGPVGAGVGGGKPGMWRTGSHGRGAGGCGPELRLWGGLVFV